MSCRNIEIRGAASGRITAVNPTLGDRAMKMLAEELGFETGDRYGVCGGPSRQGPLYLIIHSKHGPGLSSFTANSLRGSFRFELQNGPQLPEELLGRLAERYTDIYMALAAALAMEEAGMKGVNMKKNGQQLLLEGF